MLKQMNLDKMNKSAKALKTVMSVFYIAAIIGMVISLIIAVCSVVLPDSYFSVEHFKNGGFSLDVNGMFRYDMSGSDLSGDINMKGIFAGIAFAAFMYSIALFIIFKELRDILATVVQKEPFNENNADRLTRIGGVFIGGSVLFNFINSLVAGLIISTLKIKYIDVVTGINVSMLLAGFLILILAGIFKYGCYLQKEHDETV